MLPISIRQIQTQLAAMDAEVYELGVRIPKELSGDKFDRMLLRSGKTKDGPAVGLTMGDVLDNSRLNWLARENSNGHHIYIRPFGPSRLTLIDDLNAENLQKLTQTGYTPACVIETSPGNFQAWLKHNRVLSTEEGTIAAKILAEKFEGDPNSADWRHFGRLAGYTNPKEKYRLPDGKFPFSKLKLALSQGQGYPQADEIYKQVQQQLHEENIQIQKASENFQKFQSQPQSEVKVFDYQHFAQMYAEGNRKAADFVYAKHCLQRNVPEHEIIHTIRTQTQTSSYVGRSKREQDSYIQRTIDNAKRQVGLIPRAQRQFSRSDFSR